METNIRVARAHRRAHAAYERSKNHLKMVRSPDDNVDLLTIRNSTAAALDAADRRDKAAGAVGALLRPKSPTFMLACKHIGAAPEDLLEREPEPEVHSLPDDIVRLRLQHEEQRRRQLVARVRSKYEELKLAEEQRAMQARPASAPSSARPSVFERQMTRLQRTREAKMAQVRARARVRVRVRVRSRARVS